MKQITERCGLTALLPGLTQSLHNTKVARVMCSTMQCFCVALEAAGRHWVPEMSPWRCFHSFSCLAIEILVASVSLEI